MRHTLPFFKEEELIVHDQTVRAGLEMKFQNKQLVPCLAFAKHHRKLAIEICQKDIAAGIFCVLTEGDNHLSIWREQIKLNQETAVETVPALEPQFNSTEPLHSNGKSRTQSANTPSPELITLFTQELTQHIGPMADYVVKELLANRPNMPPQQLIQEIVAEIADPEEAQRIQKSLERLTHQFIYTT